MQEYQRRSFTPDAQVKSFAIVGYQGLHEKSLAPLLIVPVAAVNCRPDHRKPQCRAFRINRHRTLLHLPDRPWKDSASKFG